MDGSIQRETRYQCCTVSSMVPRSFNDQTSEVFLHLFLPVIIINMPGLSLAAADLPLNGGAA